MIELDVECPFCGCDSLTGRYNGKRLNCDDCGATAPVQMWVRLADEQDLDRLEKEASDMAVNRGDLTWEVWWPDNPMEESHTIVAPTAKDAAIDWAGRALADGFYAPDWLPLVFVSRAGNPDDYVRYQIKLKTVTDAEIVE